MKLTHFLPVFLLAAFALVDKVHYLLGGLLTFSVVHGPSFTAFVPQSTAAVITPDTGRGVGRFMMHLPELPC